MKSFNNTAAPQKGHAKFSDVTSAPRYLHQTLPLSADQRTMPSSIGGGGGGNPFNDDVLKCTTTTSSSSVDIEKQSSMNPCDKQCVSTNPFDQTMASTAMMSLPPPPSITHTESAAMTSRGKRRHVALWLGLGVLGTSLIILSGVLIYVFYMVPPGGAEDAMMQRENGGRLRGASMTITASPDAAESSMLALPPPEFVYANDDVDAQEIDPSSTLLFSETENNNDNAPLPQHSTDIKWLLGGVDVVALQDTATSPGEIVMGDKELFVVTLERQNISAAFASRQNADLFWLQPERYLPAFGGFTVWKMCSSYALDEATLDGLHYEIYNQRLVLFSGKREKSQFARQRDQCWDTAKRVYHEYTEGRMQTVSDDTVV